MWNILIPTALAVLIIGLLGVRWGLQRFIDSAYERPSGANARH
jgi:hypothetical protein